MTVDNKKITAEQIKEGFKYALEVLNTISVTGVDNCQKISMVYNNIDVFVKLLTQGKIQLIEATDNTTI